MSKKLTFIAEIGMNYNSNFGLAYELIRQAKLCGADIAKFQLGWRDKPEEINHITKDNIKDLIKWSNFFEIELMFSIISKNALELFKEFNFKSVKIASRTFKYDRDLFDSILNLNLKTFVSFGMNSLNEIDVKKTKNMFFLYCISNYPTYYDELSSMPENFNNSIFDGYSDHTLGIESSLLAISRGAKIIEKHFTLDKSDTTIRDHALSADPNELKKLIELGRNLNSIINVL